MSVEPIGHGAIPDPFDPREAIMPSGRMGAKVFFAPVGTDPTRLSAKDMGEWHQIGWAEPDQYYETTDGWQPWTPPDTPTNGGTTNE